MNGFEWGVYEGHASCALGATLALCFGVAVISTLMHDAKELFTKLVQNSSEDFYRIEDITKKIRNINSFSKDKEEEALQYLIYDIQNVIRKKENLSHIIDRPSVSLKLSIIIFVNIICGIFFVLDCHFSILYPGKWSRVITGLFVILDICAVYVCFMPYLKILLSGLNIYRVRYLYGSLILAARVTNLMTNMKYSIKEKEVRVTDAWSALLQSPVFFVGMYVYGHREGVRAAIDLLLAGMVFVWLSVRIQLYVV